MHLDRVLIQDVRRRSKGLSDQATVERILRYYENLVVASQSTDPDHAVLRKMCEVCASVAEFSLREFLKTNLPEALNYRPFFLDKPDEMSYTLGVEDSELEKKQKEN
jgi:hypothetical protein